MKNSDIKSNKMLSRHRCFRNIGINVDESAGAADPTKDDAVIEVVLDTVNQNALFLQFLKELHSAARDGMTLENLNEQMNQGLEPPFPVSNFCMDRISLMAHPRGNMCYVIIHDTGPDQCVVITPFYIGVTHANEMLEAHLSSDGYFKVQNGDNLAPFSSISPVVVEGMVDDKGVIHISIPGSEAGMTQ